MVQLPPPRCAVGRKCVELLKTYDGDELALKLAEHTADDWINLYKPKVFGERLPGIMIKYQQLSTEKERDFFNKDNPNWLNGEEMKEYADRKRGIKGENASNRRYLKETLQRLEHDTQRSEKVRVIFSLYRHVKV